MATLIAMLAGAVFGSAGTIVLALFLVAGESEDGQ